MDLKSKIREIPDFPVEGVLFRDITTLLKDREALHEMIDQIKDKLADIEFDYIAGPEARGFMIGTPLAYAMQKGFIPIRKPGKLPYKTVSCEYSLEYGTDKLEMHADSFEPGAKVVLADDLLATGGTIASVARLVEQMQGEVAAIVTLVELTELKGRKMLSDYNFISILKY